MSIPKPTSHLELLETSRDGNKINVALIYAGGELGRQLNWVDNSRMLGYFEAEPSVDLGYDLKLVLIDECGDRKLNLDFKANFLFDDQAFFGSVNNSNDGVQFFADQEGGYPIYIYRDGLDYTEALYNHLLSYNDWALENGYPQMERSKIFINSICEAFPQIA